jgi:hypothetical protein
MGFDPASLAQRAADLRAAGVVVTRPKSNFKVTTKHIGKRPEVDPDGEHDRAWWIEYEAQNR